MSASAVGMPKAIYGNFDTRENICDLVGKTDPEAAFYKSIEEQAGSVACLMDKVELTKIGEGLYELASQITLANRFIYHKEHPGFFDPNGRFRQELIPGRGSGLLVGPNWFLTAAHCVCVEESDILDVEQIKKWRIVFDFHINSDSTCKTEFSEVYKIKNVRCWHFSRGDKFADWALLELNRTVIGRKPFTIEKDPSQVKIGKELYMLGHPSGLPLKATLSGIIMTNETSKDMFSSKLCAFGGNSGSVLLDRVTQKVIGILVTGQTDYEYDAAAGYWITHVVTQDEINLLGHEGCQKISTIAELIKAIVDDESTERINKHWEYAKKIKLTSAQYYGVVDGFVVASVGIARKSRDCSRDNSPSTCSTQ
ncbi:MAG: trypsin-like serine peptidase [Chlamydiales bacterium]